MKNDLLASAPSKEMLIGLIEEYWCCDRGSIIIGNGGRIYRNGNAVHMDKFIWTKKGKRYRFEALN